MCPIPPNWFDSHQYLALWLEGIALLAIFIWDRIDASQQHKQTLGQMTIMQNQACATEAAANAATKSAEALINSERAWILVDTGEIPDNFEPNQNSLEILDVRPIVRNSGRTPGWITRGFIRYYLIPSGNRLPPEPDYRGDMAGVSVNIILAPNGVIQALHVPIPLNVFVSVRQGNQMLYVYGFVDYTDFADQIRQSRFCIEYHVPRGFDQQLRGFYMAVDVPIAYTRCT